MTTEVDGRKQGCMTTGSREFGANPVKFLQASISSYIERIESFFPRTYQ